MNDKNITCWVVSEDGLIGTENQCLGVAAALGVKPDVKRIKLIEPWKSLSPWLGYENKFIFKGSSFTAPWPDLVISAGRKAVSASRYIKKKSKGYSFTTHLQNPFISSQHFDLVAAPRHDQLKGKNVIHTDATPNQVSMSVLEHSYKTFSNLLAKVPSPRIAVLIGGNSRTHTMTTERMKIIANQLYWLAKDGNGLMITVSRRTGEENKKILEDALKDVDAFIWDGTGQNPYYGMLSWAEYILVTEDSASMISEACSTGKPTYLLKLEGQSDRFTRLHNHLIETKGVLRVFEGTVEDFYAPPLNDAHMIAREIEKRINKKPRESDKEKALP